MITIYAKKNIVFDIHMYFMQLQLQLQLQLTTHFENCYDDWLPILKTAMMIDYPQGIFEVPSMT